MRNGIRAELGDSYPAAVRPFEPFVQAELPRTGCTVIAASAAAARVIEKLQAQGADLAVQRLITCAAVDLADAS